MVIPFQIFTQSHSTPPGALLPPLSLRLKQHATPCWAGHIELHYLLLGDETGPLPNPGRSSSGGGLPSPSLAGTPSQWYHPGRWHQSSPFPNCTFPQYCSLVHRAVKAGQVHKLTARGSIRLGEPQVHSVTLLNYFGIKLKEWSNSFSIFTLCNQVSPLPFGQSYVLFNSNTS